MTPALDRDELAARFAVALACGDIASDQPERAPVDVVAFRAFEYADAFLAESSKSPTPALSPPAAVAPAPYVPKPGDVVSLSIDTGGPRTRVAISGEEYVMLLGTASGGTFPFRNFGLSKFTYLRPATPAERAAAGLPASPAPEAKRPEWVRATGPATASHVIDELVTIGKVYKVDGWVEDGSPRVIGNHGLLVALSRPDGSDCAVYSKWEPCDAPAPTPPAPSRKDALAMALREVRRMVEGGVYRTPITTYIDAALSRPAATKGGAS